MTKALPEFSVEAKVTVLTSVYIVAEDMADAVEKAKALDVLDFVKVKGDHNDSKLQVVGVSSKNGWMIE